MGGFLLLIVPGVLAAFNYAAVYYVIIDEPEISAHDALRRSKAIMFGHRWELFLFMWRFFFWFLLGIITLGIGFFWILPYFQMSLFAFFERIKPTPEMPEAAGLPDYAPYSGMSPMRVGLLVLLFIGLLALPPFLQGNRQKQVEKCAQNMLQLYPSLIHDGKPISVEEYAALAQESPNRVLCPGAVSPASGMYYYCGHLVKDDNPNAPILVEQPGRHSGFSCVLLRSGSLRVLRQKTPLLLFFLTNGVEASKEQADFLWAAFQRRK